MRKKRPETGTMGARAAIEAGRSSYGYTFSAMPSSAAVDGRLHQNRHCSIQPSFKNYFGHNAGIIEARARSENGVERGIRTLGSHSDIGLAVLRLTRLGHLHSKRLNIELIIKYLREASVCHQSSHIFVAPALMEKSQYCFVQ